MAITEMRDPNGALLYRVCDHKGTTEDDYKVKQQSARMCHCTACDKVWVYGVSLVSSQRVP